MSNFSTNTISRFVGTGPGTFSTTATTLTAPGLNEPTGLAFDARGDLFAANGGSNTITEFAAGATPGTFGATTTLTDSSLNDPFGLAVDALGDLFVANTGAGTITKFTSTGAGTFGSAQTVETGLSGPIFLTFGPSVSAPVPEASTTVSLGLLLALGLGGLVVARKRRRA